MGFFSSDSQGPAASPQCWKTATTRYYSRGALRSRAARKNGPSADAAASPYTRISDEDLENKPHFIFSEQIYV